MTYREIAPTDAHDRLRSEAPPQLLDVRQAFEFEDHRIDGATLIPLDEIESRVGELDPARPTVVVCAKGGRSAAACQFLAQRGFADLHNLTGGMTAWLAAGLPHTEGPVGGSGDGDEPRRGWLGRLFGR